MSEPKLISPLLDNFIMGDPISDRNGIRCCPAMENDSGEKYIVKIISIPASETQIEALKLTGVLKSDEEVQQYVQERTNAYVCEIEAHQQLARQEGFLPCSGYQVVPMEDSIGFDIYILTEYKRSLLRQFEKKPLSQLDAINLGLDICSALTACRRNGYLFVNLKPSNIYITDNGEYRIGDFGFLKLESLKYASVSEHYIGAYTAPEVEDAFSTPNDTLDVYAIGMILYELFNGGVLPDKNTSPLPEPQYADSELVEIILKACDPVAENRWQDPAQMGQALVGYMQKNGVDDIPIIPPVQEPVAEQEADSEVSDTAEAEAPIDDEVLAEENDIIAEIDRLIPEEADDEITDEAEIIVYEESESENHDEAVLAEETVQEEDDENSLTPAAITALEDDSSVESKEVTAKTPYEDVTVEVSEILSQADILAALQVPDPVVAPEPVEITIPEPEPQATEEESESVEDHQEEIDTLHHSEEVTPTEPTPDLEDDMIQISPKKANWIRAAIIILLFVSLIVGGFLFFKFYVVKSIDNLEIIGNKDHLSVIITSQADDSLFTVSCTDTYGKTVIVPVINDTAEFSGLSANTDYSISVNITGFHILTGKTTGKYFTPIETVVTECSVDIGTTEGSAVLKFTITGPDSAQWKFTYSAPGQQEMSAVFAGNEVTLTGLKENQIYTGYLTPVDDLFMREAQPVIFTAKELIQANNLQIVSCTDGKLLAKWQAPQSINVESWTVRCYNDATFEETVTTKNTYYEFSVPNTTDSYTVEVKAAGQNASQKDRIEKNTVTIKSISANTSVPGTVELTWDSTSTPAKGWVISYSVNGSDQNISPVYSNEKSIKISPTVPGAKYTFQVRSADAVETLADEYECKIPGATDFSITVNEIEYAKRNFQFSLCTRPQTGNWTHTDENVTNTHSFALNQDAGFVVFLDKKAEISEESNETLDISFIILDENGHLVSDQTGSLSWNTMWNNNYCYLNIPEMPKASGYYSIFVYFNAQIISEADFTIQ